MKIIEISALENGAHRNQESSAIIAPFDGWAMIPEGMECENFPFGKVVAEEIDGIMTVTSWTPLPIPEVPEPEPEPTADEILNAMLGVTE